MDWISARHDLAATGPMELIGREPEVQQLRLLVSRITQGTGEALLLSGDPGVGKTSLLDQAAAIAADSGIRLLRATGSQFEADISFAALDQLLRPCSPNCPT
jgi:predicted ATPase